MSVDLVAHPCDHVSETGRRVNVPRSLTRSLESTEEGLAMQATRTCSIQGCERTPVARNLCNRHHKAASKAGVLDQYAPTRTKITTCTVDGCDKPSDSRLCPMHKTRLKRTGTTDPRPRLTDEQVYWLSIRREAAGCWTWTGQVNNHGYGRFRRHYAHRFGWSLCNGPIPDGAEILHSCDNPPCVNPDHLRPGTHAENMAEASERGLMPTGDKHWSRRRG